MVHPTASNDAIRIVAPKSQLTNTYVSTNCARKWIRLLGKRPASAAVNVNDNDLSLTSGVIVNEDPANWPGAIFLNGNYFSGGTPNSACP